MQRQADATLVWARISQRIFSRPLLIEAQSACVVLQALASRMAIGTITLDGLPVDMRSLAMTGQETIREQREYSVSNGVATVPIRGELVGRSARLQPMSGMTGYNAIGDNLETAAADQDVRGILLDIDSPGGELGARDLAERIKALDTEKPIWALIDDFGCSAAYYIAAAADRIVMPQEGAGGSIGAIAMLPDTKGAIESMGIKVHVVRSAALKGKPLSIEGIDQEGLSIIQNIVEKAGEDFVKVVSGFRGITQKSVNETQGAVIFGRDMLSTGLADAIMPAHEARQEFEAYVNRGSSPGRRNTAGTSQMANHGSRLIYCTSTGVVREVQARPGAIIQTAGDELIVPDGMTIEQFAGLLRQNTAPLPYAPPPPPAPAPQQSGGDVAAALEEIGRAHV